MLTSSQLELELKALKPILYRDFSVTKIGVFGSFSDNTYTEDSDIDLLVEFEKPIGWNFFSLEIYLEQLFGRKIDLVTKQALKEQIKDSILRNVKYL
jgi:predicted nucleotidyltransferase